MPSWTLPSLDCAEKVEGYMRAVPLEEADFVVLFGSVARGHGGELDVLVGLREDGERRFIDRLQTWSGYGPGVKALPYYPRELRLMREQFHLVLLDASEHGLTVFDRGSWGELKGALVRLREEGKVVRLAGGGWRVV